MVQLKVYDGSDQYFLDLLSTDPIKLTLSIEDITNADARSTFSRTFRVPSTKNNNQFFKNAFLVDGIDYDVTVKKQAEILYNGAEYKVGHIRLQKIYHNKMERNTEYEIVFLGETRDFASALGEKTLSQLDLSEYNHALTYVNITNSWNAYPEGTATQGLFNGDILYPLVNFGTANGEPVIAYDLNNSFDKRNHAISPNRFKPMIRAKALWDKIFDEAGFTYSSQIADSDDFRQLYVSAWGNEPGVYEQSGSANQLDLGLSTQQIVSGYSLIEWDVVTLDPSNNYNTSTYQYQVPVTGTYEIDVRVSGFTQSEVGSGAVDIELWSGATLLDSYNVPVPSGYTGVNFVANLSFNGSLSAGNYLRVEVSESGDLYQTAIDTTSYWKIPVAAGEIGIASQLDSDYKQIDFIKDMITKFRLVMAPDKTDPKKFIVEPWADYIATGDVLDWSNKLDESKDLQLEPLFFTQSSFIEFSDKEDKDWINELNIKKFKETFGTLRVESTNELLKGKREIKTNFAPTPITQIENAKISNFLIPRIYIVNSEDAGGLAVVERTPIKPVTRLLFYNGLFQQEGTTDQGQSFGPGLPKKGEWWFLDDNNTPVDQYSFPMVSYWQDFDAVTGPGNQTVNLNWQIERGYANDYASFNWTNGVSMYQRFWSTYINSLYSKFARRLTAYFALSVEDLFNFSFDDVIFVNGSYYRPEKLTDVIVGQKSLVKVDLIKLLNYGLANPGAGAGGSGIDNPIDGVSGQSPVDPEYTTSDEFFTMSPCSGNGADIVVSPPNLIVELGQTATVGGNCYEFVSKQNWYDGLVIDAQMDNETSYVDCITCQCQTANTLTTTAYPSPASSSQTCDGRVVVNIQGGVAPYTVSLYDSSNNLIRTQTGIPNGATFTQPGLCCDDYTANVTDACGNTATDTVRVLCGPDGPSGPSN